MIDNLQHSDKDLFYGHKNRPKDQLGFPILPWGQIEELDFNRGIKNFYLDQYTACGIKIIPSIKLGTTFQTLDKIPVNNILLPEEKKDIKKYYSSIWKNGDQYIDIFENFKKEYKNLNKWWCARIENWEIVIQKAGTYMIWYYWTYCTPKEFDCNKVPYQKLWASLYSNGNEIQRFWKHIITWGIDTANDIQVSACKKWEKLSFWAKHTAGNTTLIMGAINIIRLGI